MSVERNTELLERALNGAKFFATNIETSLAIATPKTFSITTGAEPVRLHIHVKAKAALTSVVLNSGLVIGTGGSASPGTEVTIVNRELAASAVALTAIKEDYVLGSSGQSAGTVKWSEYHQLNYPTDIKLKLKANTIYGLVLTTVADSNLVTTTFEFNED
jgi:hypothetical protein